MDNTYQPGASDVRQEAPDVNLDHEQTRTGIRSTPELIAQIPGAVSPEAAASAKEIAVLLQTAFAQLKTEKHKAEDQGEAWAINGAAKAVLSVISKLQQFSTGDKRRLMLSLGSTVDKDGRADAKNPLLTTVLGDAITILAKVYRNLRLHVDKASGVELRKTNESIKLVASGILNAIQIIEQMIPGSLRTNQLRLKFGVQAGREMARHDLDRIEEEESIRRGEGGYVMKTADTPGAFWKAVGLDRAKKDNEGKAMRTLPQILKVIAQKALDLRANPAGPISSIRDFLRALSDLRTDECMLLYKTGFLEMARQDIVNLLDTIISGAANNKSLDAAQKRALGTAIGEQRLRMQYLWDAVRNAAMGEVISSEEEASGPDQQQKPKKPSRETAQVNTGRILLGGVLKKFKPEIPSALDFKPPTKITDATVQREKMVASKTPEALLAAVHDAIANAPVTALLDVLEGAYDTSALDKVAGILIPHCTERLGEYVKKIAPECQNFADVLNERERFYLALLYAKDPDSGLHTMDVYIRVTQALELPQFKDVTPNQRAAIQKAALLHDWGKLMVANVVLNNPLQRNDEEGINEQLDAYIVFLKEEKRPEAKLPERLQCSEEQKEKFGALLKNPAGLSSGERSQIADEIKALCVAQKVGDVRFVLPTAHLLKYSKHLLDSGNGDERTMKRLKEQDADLHRSDKILAAYGIGPSESFAGTNARHERASQELAERANRNVFHTERDGAEAAARAARAHYAHVINIFAFHHDYEGTRKYRETSPITAEYKSSPGYDSLRQLLRAVDIMVALRPLGTNERAYSAPKSPEKTKAILLADARRGHIDATIAEALIGKFVEPEIAQKAKEESAPVREKTVGELCADVYDAMRGECAGMNDNTMEMLESAPVDGNITTEQSSAIHMFSEAMLLATKNQERARDVQLYLEQHRGIIPTILTRVLHKDMKGFFGLFEQLLTEVEPDKSPGTKYRRFFVKLGEEMKRSDFVFDLGASGVSDVDEKGFPIGVGEFDATQLNVAVDILMSDLRNCMGIKDPRTSKLYRKYFESHQDAVLFLLSSSKQDHFEEFKLYMGRIEEEIRRAEQEMHEEASQRIGAAIEEGLAGPGEPKTPDMPAAGATA